MEMTPEAMSAIIFGMKNGLNFGVSSPCHIINYFICKGLNSSITWFSDYIDSVSIQRIEVILPFCSASFTATSAYEVNGSYLLDSLLGIKSSKLKSFISKANFVLSFSVSNLVIGPAPLLPLIRLDQKSFKLLQMGVKAPMLVTTTLFMVIILNEYLIAPEVLA